MSKILLLLAQIVVWVSVYFLALAVVEAIPATRWPLIVLAISVQAVRTIRSESRGSK